jgi:MoaA/NifB/PqqE/SkfB family radical SAM enzyme
VANLAISTVCNQDCAYCFTVDHFQDHREAGSISGPGMEERFLPMDAFQERLVFLKRSGIKEVRLLGGEPTLHPQFVELVKRAVAAGMGVVVFTNGLMPAHVMACLEALSPEQCTVMVNVNEPEVTGEDGAHRQRRDAMRALGERALPGFNICQPDFRIDFLLALIAETGCKRVIRLGLAQPCLSGSNQYIHPNQYRAIALKIVDFARAAAERGVALDFDCGFVRCMFSDGDLSALRATGASVAWRCNPILDVDIQGYVIHCYPLSRLARLPLASGRDAAAFRHAFEERGRVYRQAGVFKECSTCPFKAMGECPGGCLAMTIRRFQYTPFRVDVPGEVVV